MEQNDLASKTGCNIDSDLCFTCAVCNFMANSTEHLIKHTKAVHHGMPPIFSTKITSEPDYASTKQADSLSMLAHGDGNVEVNLSTRERRDFPIHSDSTLKLEYIDYGTEDDSNNLKPNVKDLSKILLNINDSFNEFSSSFVKAEVEHDDKMFCDINQSTKRQENKLPSLSNYEVKDEIMHCQSCSYSDIDLGKLKSHKFKHHPTEAAVVTNYFGETNLNNIHDNRFFCIKETCLFSTTICNVYEQHLLRCCSMHQTMSRVEIERLKSTITFVLNFHHKFGLDTVAGFLDFVSSFNKICTSNAVQDKISKDVEVEFGISSSGLGLSNSTLLSDVKSCQSCDEENRNSECSFSSVPATVLLINTQNTDLRREVGQKETLFIAKQEKLKEQLIKTDSYEIKFPSSNKGEICNIESSIDHLVSDNVELENDIAGRPLYDNNAFFSEEMRKDTINKCTEDFGEDNIPFSDMREHKEERRFKYSDCGEGFSQKGKFTSHKRIHSREEPYKCSECGKGFSRSDNLRVHMIKHSGEKPYKCNECCKGFSRPGNLRVHMSVHRGEKPYKCNECGKGFSQKYKLTVHMIRHSGEKPYKCNECDKCFGRTGHLKVHMRIHSGERPYKCNECGKGFSQKYKLTQHMRKHSGERPYKCNECGKCFTQTGNLKEHMNVHSREHPYKCNECGKCFSQTSRLTLHMRIHSGERPYKCIECGKGFNQRGNLKVHMNVHGSEKLYKCNECGKCFSRTNNLKVHMNVHGSEKPYKCTECGKGFTQTSSLKVHMNVHRGEKPYKCNECGNDFSRIGNLRVHMGIHSGEKPYKCNECGKGFSRADYLKIHKNVHRVEKPYKCTECGKYFSRTSNLKVHSHKCIKKRKAMQM